MFENKAAQPSPRGFHSSWDYAEKMWSFGGEGVLLDGYSRGRRNDEKFLADEVIDTIGKNIQLLCFDPCREEWSVPDTCGMLPAPVANVSAVRLRDKVYIGQPGTSHVYVLDMPSLTWSGLDVSDRIMFLNFQTITTISDTELVVHGGMYPGRPQLATWILNVETGAERVYPEAADHARLMHTAVKVGSQKSVMIVGGCRKAYIEEDVTCDDIYWIKLEPDRLDRLALETVHKHREKLQEECKEKLPASVYADLLQMHREDVITYWTQYVRTRAMF
jgi:hypothetical protein